jgi:hypothetical protein
MNKDSYKTLFIDLLYIEGRAEETLQAVTYSLNQMDELQQFFG